jgi:hypothetical protein
LAHGDRVRVGDVVIRLELELSAASPPAPSLETQDVEPDTKQLDSPSLEKHKADQPSSACAPGTAPSRMKGLLGAARPNANYAIGKFRQGGLSSRIACPSSRISVYAHGLATE